MVGVKRRGAYPGLGASLATKSNTDDVGPMLEELALYNQNLGTLMAAGVTSAEGNGWCRQDTAGDFLCKATS